MYTRIGDDMKKILFLFTLLCTVFLCYICRDDIREFILVNFVNEQLIVEQVNNEYTKSNSFEFNQTNDFYPESKEDIINLFFTALNNGSNTITFFCSNKYKNCIEDVNYVFNDSTVFNKINNYVHPYNSYKQLLLKYNSLGQVTIDIVKQYSEEEIFLINQEVKKIIDTNITNTMSTKDKIKTIHDYIINNTKYDEESANKIKNNIKISANNIHKASGVLFNNLAVCGGYTDTMAIFLNELDIKNYKIYSDVHVWNYVNLNNEWLHLDLTWDDPITNTGEQILLHNYFLITEKKLKELDSTEHNYK